jgi:CRISPR-associated protein Csm3
VADGLRLLQLDYLGGHGTRGYGKVRFADLSARRVWGDLDAAATATLNELLKDVENDALSPA